MNFAAIDLNLLRVFDAMTIELNTTRAGERVGLSQPAVSSALGRLRHIVGDELFVREGNRMVPTPRAVTLREPIREALRQLEDALSAVARFEPAAAAQTFRISGSDYFSTLLMPRLSAAVMAEAPGVTLQMLDHPTSDALRLLGEGAIDMGVEASFDAPDWVCTQPLFQSFIVSAAPKNHPILARAGIKPGGRIPPDIYCTIPQVLMSMDGGRTGTVDRCLPSTAWSAGCPSPCRISRRSRWPSRRPACSAACRSTSRVRRHGCSISIFICRPTIRRSSTWFCSGTAGWTATPPTRGCGTTSSAFSISVLSR